MTSSNTTTNEGEKEVFKYKGIIPEDLDQMKWFTVNAKLSVFGIEKTDFVGSVQWQLDGRWKWVLHNTRFTGIEDMQELAQLALCQIFEDAKNIPEVGKKKTETKVKSKKKESKED